MSASPHPTNTSRSPVTATHASENDNSNRPNVNGTYLNPRNSELFRNRRSANNPAIESIPLIDANLPPLAKPEMELNESEIKNSQPSVDDVFLSSRANEDGPNIEINNSNNAPNSLNPDNGNGDESDRGRNRGTSEMSNRPFSPGIRGNNPFPDFELGTIPELAESIPDVNVYQHKKTLAQGMMDLALFSANANQLRYVLDSNGHPFYYSGIVLISISLLFQVAIGVGLIWNSRYNVKDDREICIANKINNFTIIGIFLVTVINVFISAFGVASVQTIAIAAPVAPLAPPPASLN